MMTSGPVISRRILLKWAGIGGAAAFAAGCTSATPPPAGTAVPAGSPIAKAVTVSFGPYGNADQFKMFGDIIDGFEKKYPNIKVDRRFDTSLDTPKLHNQVRSGTAADLLRINDDDIFFLTTAGGLLILDDYVKRDLKRDDYSPKTWTNRSGPGGELPCLLFGTGTSTFFYNIDHFKEAGITAPTSWTENNWTLDQFEANCRKLGKKTGDKVDRYAVFFNVSFGYNFFPNAGLKPWNEDETKSLVNTPEAVALFDRLQKWYTVDKFAVPPGEDSIALFNAGRLSMYNIGWLTGSRVDPKINFDLAPWPVDKVKPALAFCGDLCFPIYARTKYPEETWQLAKYFMLEEAQTAMAKAEYLIPAMTKVAQGPAFMDPNRPPKGRKMWFDARENAWSVPKNPMGDIYAQTMSRQVVELQSGAKTATAFLAEKEKILNQAVTDSKWSKANQVMGWRLPGIPEKTGYPTVSPTTPYK